MDLSFLFKGIIVGLIVAVPVGPIGVLCLCRTLTEGRLHGIVSGLGAATADAVYGFVAMFGISAISGLLVRGEIWFRLLAAIALGFLGFKLYFSQPAKAVCSTEKRSLSGDYISTFFLTLTNPTTVLTFIAMFAALGAAAAKRSFIYGGELVLGVFIGSALWWLVLGSGLRIFDLQLNQDGMKKVRKVAGLIIAGLGILILLSLW